MILLPEQLSPTHIPEYYQILDWASLIKKDSLSLERISIKDKDGNNIIFAQVYIYKLIYKYTQLYIPRGPILYTDNISQAQIQEFWQDIESIVAKYKAIFTLIEPAQDLYNNCNDLLDEYSQNTIIERLPHQTQVLDLSLSEEDLLQNMHPKMRYNIRLAKKKRVGIQTISKNHLEFEKYFDIFFELMQETAKRGDFAIHPKSHYRHLLQHSSENITVSLIIAEYEQNVLAANMILDTIEQRVYLHGASSSQNRNLMAPPLLQWEAILEAKKLGKKIYDFWGVSKTKKSWQGISRFKTQFGGSTIDYPDSRIAIHNKLIFTLYSLFRKIRGKVI